MKRAILGIILIMVFLVGCGNSTVDEIPKDGDSRFNGIKGSVKIITDSETSCKYIYVESGMAQSKTVAMSPLMKDHSHVDCD